MLRFLLQTKQETISLHRHAEITGRYNCSNADTEGEHPQGNQRNFNTFGERRIRGEDTADKGVKGNGDDEETADCTGVKQPRKTGGLHRNPGG